MYKIFKNFFSREGRIKEKLVKEFNPKYLEVINESYKHSVPKDAETHFKLVIISNEFKNKSTVLIHKKIYGMFMDEMGEKKDNKLHALSIHTKTEDDWKHVQESPDCVFKKH
jgi:BolA protein